MKYTHWKSPLKENTIVVVWGDHEPDGFRWGGPYGDCGNGQGENGGEYRKANGLHCRLPGPVESISWNGGKVGPHRTHGHKTRVTGPWLGREESPSPPQEKRRPPQGPPLWVRCGTELNTTTCSSPP